MIHLLQRLRWAWASQRCLAGGGGGLVLLSQDGAASKVCRLAGILSQRRNPDLQEDMLHLPGSPGGRCGTRAT